MVTHYNQLKEQKEAFLQFKDITDENKKYVKDIDRQTSENDVKGQKSFLIRKSNNPKNSLTLVINESDNESDNENDNNNKNIIHAKIYKDQSSKKIYTYYKKIL